MCFPSIAPQQLGKFQLFSKPSAICCHSSLLEPESVIQKTQNIEEKELEPIIEDPDSNLESTTQTQAQPIRDIFSVKKSASEKAKEKIKKRKIEHLADSVQNLRHVTESVYENENNTNEHDAFGNFVAASLKVLPTAKALLAQSEIHSILMKHRLTRSMRLR
ncbi:hypothetical protein J6590_041450 [Homalodisca vitripennis]|nr:hypothetical protein J6590_041450 [Homalodisca vitripennis]